MTWIDCKLGELLRVEHGFAFKGEHFTDVGDLVVLTPGNFHEQGGFRPRPGKDRFYAAPFPDRYLLKKGDVIVAMTEQGEGLLGSSAVIPESDRYLHNQRLGLVKERADRANRMYLYYLFNTPHVREQIRNTSSGAKVRHTSPERIYGVSVRVPIPEEQVRIAAILSAYDDLIASNRRRIELLERMAEEIYREWFVRMRFPGADSTAAIDAIPAGWTLESLEDLGTFLNGYAFDPSEWFDFGLPIIKIKELNAGVTVDTPRNPGERLQERYRFSDGDVIFSWSGSLVVKIWDQGDAWLNQHLFKVTPKASVSRTFLYLSIKFSIPIFESLTTGATMQHIKRKELRFVKVRVPGAPLMRMFDEQVGPMLDAALKLRQVNRRLSETRDALLPRLISGKLKVDHLDIRLPPSMRSEAEAVA